MIPIEILCDSATSRLCVRNHLGENDLYVEP